MDKYKFIVEIDVHTDGDFTYAKRKEKCILCEDWERACIALRNHIQNLVDTIEGRHQDIVPIRAELEFYLEEEMYVDMSAGPNFSVNFSWGNQEALFQILPLTFSEGEDGLSLNFDYLE